MKRSEMQIEIAKLIETFGNTAPMFQAQKVLEKVEELGMKPPFLEPSFDTSLGESLLEIENYKWEK